MSLSRCSSVGNGCQAMHFLWNHTNAGSASNGPATAPLPQPADERDSRAARWRAITVDTLLPCLFAVQRQLSLPSSLLLLRA